MSQDPRVRALLTKWEATRTVGPPPTAEELCADAPELLPEVREELRLRNLADTPARVGLDTASRDEPADDAEKPPASVGGMPVTRVLGRGGMGWVLEVEDPKLFRRVAVKLMLPTLAANPSARKRFLREARAQASIDHEHVAAIHSIHDESDPPFLVMPLLKGRSLAERIAEAVGPLPVSEVTRIGAEMSAGLAAAHANGLIHRDVKPSNVWLEGEKGKVRLLDFGLARLTDGADDVRITRSGELLGTPAYMAPEQAAGGHVDARADLFSLGCVLYQMSTGHRPFGGDSLLAVISALATHTPRSVRSLNPAVPQPLADLIAGLLEKSPDRRTPATASEVAARLERIAVAPPPDAPPVFPPPQSCRPGPRRPPADQGRRRHEGRKYRLALRLVALAAVAGLACVVVAVLLTPAPQGVGRLPTDEPTQPDTPVPTTVLSPPPTTKPTANPTPEHLRWPFSADDAGRAQQAWAKHLSRKAEEEIDLGDGVKLVLRLIPPGEFMMGSPASEPGRKDDEEQRPVVIERPFYAGKYEVTQREYQAVMGQNPSKFAFDDSYMPVESVRWDAAAKFCEKATAATDRRWRFRLPTEEEWEWLTRAGGAKAYNTGDEITTRDARFNNTTPWAVGSGTPNAFGLYDTHGNVWEWCQNKYRDADGGELRALRGGAWFELNGKRLRSAFRGFYPPDTVSGTFGFRVIAEPPKP